MEDLVLEGGRMPCAADFEDLGTELLAIASKPTRVANTESKLIPSASKAEQQTKQPPKQVIRVLYGVLGLAVGTLAWLWTKML